MKPEKQSQKPLKALHILKYPQNCCCFSKVYKNQKQKRVHLTHHVTLKCATCSTYFLEVIWEREEIPEIVLCCTKR